MNLVSIRDAVYVTSTIYGTVARIVTYSLNLGISCAQHCNAVGRSSLCLRPIFGEVGWQNDTHHKKSFLVEASDLALDFGFGRA